MVADVHLHGIRNCDIMKKARAWLDANGVSYTFHDYKAEGVARAMLVKWCTALGWETVLNKAGTTFRALPDASRSDLTEAKAIELMLAQPSMIKRPILEMGDRVVAGFKPATYETLFLRS
jgi:arsenate reductase